MTEHTPQTVAAEALRHFETRTRHDGTTYVTRTDTAPEWIEDMVYAAHDDGAILPDDYRYRWTRDALEWIADEADPEDGAEFSDQAVPHATHERIAWLGSHGWRPGYVDNAAAEFGRNGGIVATIGLGMYLEAEEVYAAVGRFVTDRADDLNDDRDRDEPAAA